MGVPLNGKSRMTPEERRARRRELESMPFRKALIRKRKSRWVAKNRDIINAKRRKKYAEDADARRRILEGQKKRRNELGEEARRKKAEYIARYYRDHRMQILDRMKERSKNPEVKARHDAVLAARKARFHSDPEFREKVRRQKRETSRRRRHKEEYRRHMLETHFIPLWKDIMNKGAERIAKYLRAARPENRRAFMLWYTKECNLIDRKSPARTDFPNDDDFYD